MTRQGLFARFRRSSAGVSGVEFAFVFPILLILLLAGGQLTLYINATRKVQQIATSVSEMLSQATPPTTATSASATGTGIVTATVNATDLNFGYDASLVIFPYVMGDAIRRNIPWRQALTVSFAGISFSQQSKTCDGTADLSPCYTAKVNWTSTGTSAGSFRPCTLPQVPVDDTASPNKSNLPRSVFGPGSIIAVDVTFTFTPTFGSNLVRPVTITRSAFVQPRYADQIDFDTTSNDGIASKCST